MNVNKATHEPYNVELFAPIMKQNDKYVAVLSDTSIDRDGERVGKSALSKVASKPGYLAALMDHENKVLNQVAQWKNIRLEDIDGHYALVAEPHFFKSNPNARIIKGMLDEGAELGISIGAIVKEYEDQKVGTKSIRTFTDMELLEASFVAIPANSHGRAMAVAKSYSIKSKKEESKVEKEYTKKDVDSMIEKKSEEMKADFDKQVEAKDVEISELTQKVEESVKASEKKLEEEKKVFEGKVEELEKSLESEKKASLEKQSFIETFQKNEGSDEQAEKAIKEGKIPFIKYE